MATYYDLNGQPYTPPAPTGPAPGRGMPAPTPSGSNGLLGYAEAPIAGALGTAANIVQAGQAGAKAVGLDSAAAKAASWADYLRQAGAGFQSPELEQNAATHPWSPSNIGYQVLKGAPGALATLGGAVLGGPEAAGAAIGAGIASLPQMIGQNVETSEASNGSLTQGQAAKAIALGVPEAALGAWSGGRAAQVLAGGIVAKSAARAAASQAFIGAVTGAGQDIIAQQMGDPNRPIASRMNEMITSALTGGATGALLGGGLHALAKVDPNQVTPEDINRAVGQGLGIEPPPSTENATQSELPLPTPVNAEHPYQGTPQGRLDQLSAYFSGIASPDMFQQHQAGLVEAERSLRAAAPKPGTRGNPVLPGDVTPIDAGIPQPTLWDQGQVVPPARPLAEVNDLPQPPTAEDFETEQGPEPAIMFSPQQIGNPLFKALNHTNADTQRASFMDAISSAQRVGDVPLRTRQEVAAKALGLKVDDHKLVPETAPNAPSRDSIEPANRPIYDQAQDLREAAKDDPAVDEALDKVQSNPASPDAPVILKAVEDYVANKEPTPQQAEPIPPEPVTGPSEAAIAQTPVNTKPVLDAITEAKKSLAMLKTRVTGRDDLAAVDQGYKQALDAQNTKLDQITEAVKDGGSQAREALASVGTKPFAMQQIFDDYGGNFPRVAQALMKNHLGKEQAVLSELAKAYPPSDALFAAPRSSVTSPERIAKIMAAGDKHIAQLHEILQEAPNDLQRGRVLAMLKDFNDTANEAMGTGNWEPVNDAVAEQFRVPGRPLLAAPAESRPATQQGVDLEHITNNGGTLKDHLAYLQTDGENGAIKTVSRLLSQKGVDAKVQIGDQGLPPDRPAMYDPKMNTITVRQGQANGQLVAHEAVHAGTVKGLAAGGPAARDMNHLFDVVKEQSPNKNAYGLTSVEEFTSEGFTNPDFQADLRSMPADESLPGKPTTMWQAFKNAVGRVLGMDTGAKRTMLDQVLETGNRLMDENAAAPETGGSPLYGATERVKQAQELKGKILDNIRGLRLPNTLVADESGDIANVVLARRGVKSAPAFFEALKDKENIGNVVNKANSVANDAQKALPAKSKETLNRAIFLTENGMFPDKTWAEQSADVQEAAKTNPILKQRWVDANRAFNADPAAAATYRLLVAGNNVGKMSTLAAIAHDQVLDELGRGAPVPGFETNPGRAFQLNRHMQDSPIEARGVLKADLTIRSAALDKILGDNAGKFTPEQTQRLMDAQALIKGAIAEPDAVPNFHMSHGQGEYFVGGQLATGPDGKPLPEAVAGLQKILEADGFGDKHLDVLHDATLFTRVENQGIAKKLEASFQKALAAKHLDSEHGVASGLASEPAIARMQPAVIQGYLKRLKANMPSLDDLPPEQQAAVQAAIDQHYREIQRAYMDILPSSSATKLLAKKENVQLANEDAAAAFSYRSANQARQFANLSTSHDYTTAMAAMRDELTSVNKTPLSDSFTLNDKVLAQKGITELFKRQMERPDSAPAAVVSFLKGLSYRMELASPAYALLLHSQIPTLVLPRLASVRGVGYVKASKYLGQSVADTFRVMRGIWSDPNWTSGGVRYDNLIKQGLSKDQAELMVGADNRGLISGSSFTKQMAPNEEGSGALAKVANVSSGFILSAEIHPRVIAVLAAKRAFDNLPAENRPDQWKFIAKMVDKSNLDFSGANASRIQSRSGPLGETAPLFTQFTNFRSMMTTMLYREFENGFLRKDATADERHEARSFLLGHLAATTMLAGSLGLPMVGVLASVADKLADWATGDPTHDFIASYRGWLTHMYGATAGEAIARGLPRLAGADFQKASEASLVPWISDALQIGTEKRKLEDAEKDWLKKVAGPAIALPVDWALGARDIVNGDYLRGMQKMVPEGLRGATEAAEAMKYGYRDKRGAIEHIGAHQLTPTAQDIALLALGLEPAKTAEYDEQQRVASGLSTRKQLQSQVDMQHLLQSYQRRDPADFAYWENQAGPVWMSQHPGTEPPIARFDQAVTAQARQQALGLPQSVNVNDIRAKGMINFANSH